MDRSERGQITGQKIQGRHIGWWKCKFVDISDVTTIGLHVEAVPKGWTDYSEERSEGGQITERTNCSADRFQGRQIGRWKYRFVDIADVTTIGQEAFN